MPENSLNQRAKILLEALPYIKKYRGKRVVIKLSGSVIDDPHLEEQIAKDIVLLHFVGMMPIVVHGGGTQITSTMQQLGKEAVFSGGRRVTDPETMSIAQMVLVGKVNKSIVSSISRFGAEAVGISGQDGKLLLAQKRQEQDLGRVGHIKKVNISLLERIYGSAIIPVIAPVAVDEEAHPLNVNADEVATEIAAMLCVEKLIFVSDVRGVLKRAGKPKSAEGDRTPTNTDEEAIYNQLSIEKIDQLLKEKSVLGGMVVKLQSAKRAILEGVRSVQIVSGVQPHSLLVEIFTDVGVGTKITL